MTRPLQPGCCSLTSCARRAVTVRCWPISLPTFRSASPSASDYFFVLRPGSRVDAMREVKVESHWLHKGRVVLKFSQVDSIADAENLRGFDVVIPREERMPLEGDAVYVSDLLGVRVIDVSRGGAADAGEITDVEPEGAGPAMLVIRTPAGDELLIPFVRAYLRKMDIEAKRLEMDLPEGLLAMQTPSGDESE